MKLFWNSAVVAVAVVAAMTPAKAQKAEVDPIVGRWRWFNAIVVDIEPDGTFSVGDTHRGEWKPVKDKRRQYLLRWDEGVFEDKLTLSSDFQKLKGWNQQRVRVSGTRINPF
jgi:hypothetical protein